MGDGARVSNFFYSFFAVGGRGGVQLSIFFTKNSNLNKKWRGARVCDFF